MRKSWLLPLFDQYAAVRYLGPHAQEQRMNALCWNSDRRVRNGTGARLGLLSVNKNEGDAARLCSTIHPGVVGALLHQDIASLEMNFGVIEQHVDLAFHDNRVIDGTRPVHQWVPRRQAFLRRMVTDLLVQKIGRKRLDFRRRRRDIDDAEDAATD